MEHNLGIYEEVLHQESGSRNGEVSPDLGHVSEIKLAGLEKVWLCHFVTMQRTVWERKVLKRTSDALQ